MKTYDLFDLKGKVAVITGGGGGLGTQMAQAFADAGCTIVLCSRKLENCEAAAEELTKLGAQVQAYACDVTDQDQVKQLVENVIAEFGSIDILVNNSGTTWGETVEDMPLHAWEKVMTVNVTGTFLMSQEVGKHMIKQQSGKIINIASVAGLKAEPPEVLNAIGYSTSKGAVVHFTKDLARKWAEHNINVNAIAPGFFPSKMTRVVLEQRGDAIKEKNPMKRIGGEHDLKGVTLFLGSRASDFVTGQIIAIDGGASL